MHDIVRNDQCPISKVNSNLAYLIEDGEVDEKLFGSEVIDRICYPH